MDWGNDYFTFSDTNIEYIWRFLQIVHERGWLYVGHRSTEWCPRCGTSLSQHELTQSGVYQEKPTRRSSSASRCSTATGESVVVWTTTPWTLPANVAAAVNPEAEYGLRDERRVGARSRATPTTASSERVPGAELVGLRYRGPFDDLAAGRGRRAPRRPLGRGLARGGHRHRPHRDRLRRRGLRARQGARPAGAHAGRRGGPLLRRLRLAARPLDDRGGRPDRRRARASAAPRRGGHLRAPLPALLALRHAAHLPDLRRLVHRRRRRPRAAARGERDGRVGAGVHGQAHGRLAAQHGRLEHLARAATTGCRCRSTRAPAGT